MATINGTSGDDSLAGTSSADLIRGYAGNDTITASGGNDTIRGGQGDDVLEGGGDNDTFTFEANNNGNDTVRGGGGNDTLNALDSDATATLRLNGEGGNDLIVGRGGIDIMTGGTGFDQFVFHGQQTNSGDRITDFDAGNDDTIVLEAMGAASDWTFNFAGDGGITKAQVGSDVVLTINAPAAFDIDTFTVTLDNANVTDITFGDFFIGNL